MMASAVAYSHHSNITLVTTESGRQSSIKYVYIPSSAFIKVSNMIWAMGEEIYLKLRFLCQLQSSLQHIIEKHHWPVGDNIIIRTVNLKGAVQTETRLTHINLDELLIPKHSF